MAHTDKHTPTKFVQGWEKMGKHERNKFYSKQDKRPCTEGCRVCGHTQRKTRTQAKREWHREVA